MTAPTITGPHEKPTHPKYRADIDGLRAIAVLSVVVFHAFPELTWGGFIGVDIFFVISGFLISTIIYENLDQKTFSFIDFYSRRIRRIFPALALVLIACLIYGSYSLFSGEYKQLRNHVAAGAAFYSNIIFWNENGYFDSAAETKPLLHLWSLGIEEQFYIMWPLLIWFGWRYKFNQFYMVLLVAISSFLLNIVSINKDSVATFYSPQTRFWELLIGGAFAWILFSKSKSNLKIISPIHKNLISITGFVFLTLGMFLITKKAKFPGWWALLPVGGAVLIIGAGANAWLNRVVLGNRVLVWFGLISFPLYLWHWPVLSFARITEAEEPHITVRIFLVFISIFLAGATYYFVERPLRFGRRENMKAVVLFGMMTAIGLFGFIGRVNAQSTGSGDEREIFLQYFENSLPNQNYMKKSNIINSWHNECAFFDSVAYREGRLTGDVRTSKPVEKINESCYTRNRKFSKSLLIWGDSHAQAISFGVEKNIPANWQVLQVATSACPPDPNVQVPSTTSQCDQSNYFALKTVADARPDVVIIAQRSSHNAKNALVINRKLSQLGVKKVIYVGPFPEWTADLPNVIVRKLWSTKPRRAWDGVNLDVLKFNEQVKKDFFAEKIPNFADVIDLFCNKSGCMTYIGDDIMTGVTTWDYGHLTNISSDYLAKNLLVRMIIKD